jgi:hypothetical protein
MNHPLLTKVLGDAFYGSSDPDEHPSRAEVSGLMVDAIPPDIADRLEWALEGCAWNGDGYDAPCWQPKGADCHRNPGIYWEPEQHPFQPLVTA